MQTTDNRLPSPLLVHARGGAARADRRDAGRPRAAARPSNATPTGSTRFCSSVFADAPRAARGRSRSSRSAATAAASSACIPTSIVLVLFDGSIGADDERFVRGLLQPALGSAARARPPGPRARRFRHVSKPTTPSSCWRCSTRASSPAIASLFDGFMTAFHRPDAARVHRRVARDADRRSATRSSTTRSISSSPTSRTRRARCAT